MKNEIPPIRPMAPTTIAIAPVPLRPLSVEELPVDVIAGVVVAGVVADDGGSPGESGLPGAPKATVGAARLTATITQPTARGLTGLTLLALRGERLLHGRRLRSITVGLLVRDVLLEVDVLRVDRPDVVVRAEEDVVDGSHRGEHRVV
jgi:hypothetical protein